MLLLTLAGCLINHELYEERLAELLAEDEATADGGGEGCEALWYLDLDEDGYGDPSVSVQACEAPEGHVGNAADCDDGDPAVHPGAEEIPYDGVDNDCQGGDLVDVDGDGHAAVEAGGEDCDDADPAVHPGAAETWENGATDNDCDGERGAALLEYGAEAWTGEAAGDNAGRRLAALGDLNGDGLAEFAASSFFQSRDYSYGGAIYIVSGGEPGPLAEEGVVRSGGANWMIGGALSGGADVDGDGLPDLLVGSSAYDGGRGAAWLLSGADLPAEGEEVPLPEIRSWELLGEQADGYLGASVSFVGDIDGDGLTDVAVGQSYWDGDGLVEAGRVGIWTAVEGVGVMEEADVELRGFYDGQQLGASVMPAGDQDGDGYEDYMVSGIGVAAAIVSGGVAEPSWERDMLALVTGDAGLTRIDALMVGDLDGNGRPDLALIVGSADVHFFTLLSANPSIGFETPSFKVVADGESVYIFDVTDLGDLDGDGRDETLVHPQAYLAVPASASFVLFGDEVVPGGASSYLSFDLRAMTARDSAAFGYRALAVDDVDGDGTRDVIMGGYADSEAGAGAGAIVRFPIPR
jgi:hypothetical protein